MKPKNRAADGGELTSTEGASNKTVELSDDEKWDKAIKGLTKNKLARVEKTDAGQFVSLV